MNYTLTEKAYQIDFSQIDEGYLWAPAITWAETKGKAKKELLKEVEGATHATKDEDINFLNIPVIRCKEKDKYDYKGESLTEWQILQKIESDKKKNEFESILKNPEIKYCYIRKGSYYRPNNCGYTDVIYKAGVYKKEDAIRSARSCDDLRIIPIDIKEHNSMIQEQIDDLQTRIL